MDRSHAEFHAAIARIVQAGHAARIPVTLHAVRPDEASARFSDGFDEVVLTPDVLSLRNALSRQLETARR
jgi:hypothetical protein